jgi:chloride channel 7
MSAGEDAISHLLSRGTHREFGYKPLLLMLVFYFCGAAVIAGSALSTGLFVPMLVIGCLIGVCGWLRGRCCGPW